MKTIIKAIKYILFVAVAATILEGCKENEALMYDNNPALYFYRGTFSSQQRDSISYSFYLMPEGTQRDIVYLDVRTMGLPVGIDRAIKFIQTNSSDTDAAKPGVHYVDFDSPEVKEMMIIKANAVEGKIPVILLNGAEMKEKKLRLAITIGENEYFKPGIDDNRNFVIKTTAMAEEPASWKGRWRYTFGTWSKMKMWFIINIVGFSDFDYEGDDLSDEYQDFLQLRAADLLKVYNAQHGEMRLCDDEGKVHPGGAACENCVIFP